MGFRLDPTKDLHQQVRVVLDAEWLAARRAARTGDDDAVHAIRRHGKRSRALLRLVRPALTDKGFTEVNRAWRDIGRLLSAARDHRVIADCLTALVRRYPEDIPGSTLTAMRRLLPVITPTQRLTMMRRVRAALDRLRPRLRHLHGSGGWSKAVDGHIHTLKACRSARLHVARRGTAAHRHTWRKRVKDTSYQTHLLARLCPGMFAKLEQAGDDLGGLLGRENDLVMTCGWLTSLHDPNTSTAMLRAARRWLRHLRRDSNRVAEPLTTQPRRMRMLLMQAREALS
ncbi:MAG: CHAD domain-containing protein [Planctomycetes bacterium]|jgi:hypothetical protein|nr:CHAD domain-containing protein [Planctomycetota bacterium]